MLHPYHTPSLVEAGCDEAGRGPLAGPVFAAAVIFPPDVCQINELAMLNDSKQLSENQRNTLRPLIEKFAITWSVTYVSAEDIDKFNILRASIQAMHEAIRNLTLVPQHIIVDGNRWLPYRNTPNDVFEIPCTPIVKGDGKFMSIAAASVLAKTYRDDYMLKLDELYPVYQWKKNKGYPTKEHYIAIQQYGLSPFHRKSFRCFEQGEK